MTVKLIYTCDLCGNEATENAAGRPPSLAPTGWAIGHGDRHICPLDHTRTDHIEFRAGELRMDNDGFLTVNIVIPVDQPAMQAIAVTGWNPADWHLTRKTTP